MPYVPSFNRDQIMMCSWDSFVDQESVARLIDAFVDSLDLKNYGINEPSFEGRPAYDPKSLFKLYIYGYRKGIRSSRKLAECCHINIEVKWMTGGVEPDFRTISDFRKNNIKSLKKIFHEFNKRISGAVEWGFVSVDGSKFNASNSKDSNFTKNKLDDRIKWLDAHSDEYLRTLNDMDTKDDEKEPGTLTREEVNAKLEETEERLTKYKYYRQIMEETGVSQLSLTDADAKLMKSKNGFTVSYNPQTVVDSETHLIRDFNMTNKVTDHGLLSPTLEGIRSENKNDVIEMVADKGYEDHDDMGKCLENGIIPNVIGNDGVEEYEFEFKYEEADGDISSSDPDEIKKCLHAGKIPEVYSDVITDINVEEVRRKINDESTESQNLKSPYGTPEQMQERAKEGYFVRDPERNFVYCPNGEVLRQKSITKAGYIRYANKNACKHCKYRDKCYSGKNEWKEIEFTKDCLEKPCRQWLKKENGEGQNEVSTKPKPKDKKGHFEKIKIVKLKFKPDQTKMNKRKSMSEHPFGTIKRAMGGGYFLLRGMSNVSGEFALMCLGYNLERAKNLLGFKKMMELMQRA